MIIRLLGCALVALGVIGGLTGRLPDAGVAVVCMLGGAMALVGGRSGR